MTLLTPEQVRAALAGYKLTYVAEKTGLSYATARKVLTKNCPPSLPTLQALSAFVEQVQLKK